MPKKAWIVVVVVAVFLVGVLWVVNRSSNQQGTRNAIIIGAILPLTGHAGAYGKSLQRGTDLALAQVNSSASNPLKIVYEDSQADPKIATSAYRKLVDLNHVRAIIGPFTSSETFAIGPLTERNHVVILSPGASAPGITQAGDFVFRIVTSDLFDGDVLARFARQKLSFGKMAIAYINNDYGVGVRDAFSQRFQQLGGTVALAEGYSPTGIDYRTLLTKIKDAKPDGLLLTGYKEMGKVLKQAQEVGLSVPVLSTGLFEDPEILKTAGGAAEGVYYSYASFNPNSSEPSVAEFVQAFKKSYNSEPDILAALGYDAVKVMARAYADPKLSADQIRDNLYKIQNFPGVTGEMSFDQNGDVTKAFGIKRIQDGTFAWLINRY